MIRTRTSLDFVPGFSDPPPEGQFDARDPIRIAPVAASLATASCPMTGQFFAVRGSTVTLLRNWSPDGQVQRRDRAKVGDLGPELEGLPRPDMMAELMHFFEEAVGPAEPQVLVDDANTYFQENPSE